MNTVSHQTVTSNQMSNSMGSTEGDKFGGLLPMSLYKKLRNGLFSLHSYVQTEAPKMFGVHSIISIFRLLQIIGPAIFAPYASFWTSGTSGAKLSNLLSIAFHFCPAQNRLTATTGISYGYFGFIIFLMGLKIGSSIFYKKNATLPPSIPIILHVLIHTLGYIIHPMALEVSAEMIGRLIADPSSYSISSRVVEIVLVFVAFGIYEVFMHIIMNTSIVFRPNSLISTLSFPQMCVFELTALITVLLGIGSQLSRIPRIVIFFISAAVYVLMLFGSLKDGGFIKSFHRCAIVALSTVGALLCITAAVLDLLKSAGSETVIFVGLFCIVISFIVTYFVNSIRSRNALRLLDAIESDQSAFNGVKSVGELANLVFRGFLFAHPVCISWQVFRYATDRWPQDVRTWLLFAKFVAIYPEETQTLTWILHQINSLHIKGSVAKHIISEIISLVRQRESNLSPELKRKLNSINKSVTGTKHKLRHIWDLVIQGNTSEMENIISRTESSIVQTEAEYLHLLHQYPNCRFVVRSYARFKYEVCADHESFKEWAEKAKLMQRGLRVHMDQAHELGLIQFQNIPEQIKAAADTANINSIPVESESQLIDLKQDDEGSSVVSEQITNLRKKIESLTIPGIKCNTIIVLIIFFVLFLAPIIAASTLVSTAISSWEEPIDYLAGMADLRNLVMAVTQFGYHLVMEELNLTTSHNTIVNTTTDTPPSALGGTFDILSQTAFLVSKASARSQNLTSIQSFQTSSTIMNQVRTLLFSNSIDYTEYLSGTNTSTSVISLQSSIMSMLTKIEKLFTANATISLVNDSTLADPILNCNNMAVALTESLDLVYQYMGETNTSTTYYGQVALICIAIIVPIIITVMAILQTKVVNSNRLLIYKCLTSIPKNHVSVVADSLKSMKKDQDETSSKSDTDTELNKQEENMIKVFMTAGDSSIITVSGNIWTIVGAVILGGLHLGATIVLCLMYTSASSLIYQTAPHIEGFLGSSTYQGAAIFALTKLSALTNGYGIRNTSASQLLSEISNFRSTSNSDFRISRYGNEGLTITPFTEFVDEIATINDKYACSNATIYSVPNNLHQSYQCFSPELLFISVSEMIDQALQPYVQNGTAIDPNGEMIWSLWDIEFYFVIDHLFIPIFSQIQTNLATNVNDQISPSLTVGYILLACSFVVCIFLLIKNIQKDQEMKYAMSLLLHFQPTVILQIPLITQVLSGNFEIKSNDSTSRDREFFDDVIEKLPDATIIAGADGKIITINIAAERLFSITSKENLTVSSFFSSPGFEGSAAGILSQPPKTEKATFKGAGGSVDYLSITSMTVGDLSVYTARNTTQTIRYNTLIEEELAKSEKLLQSILPPKLVPRVQSGEKNISFSVQSASIVFIDIVEFTPWCAANTATKVMQTLNTLFKAFDAIIATLPTMTKIKCIGDCYMAAGGIFSDVNQPTVHASEAVKFGLQAIDAIDVVNKEMQTNLRIRVGVNTGGPIVGGVIGCGKPTFEILGPAINMAQQMEHHGIPMVVHVSRSVYELIYGATFNIKERGQVEIKNGTVVTYIVTKK